MIGVIPAAGSGTRMYPFTRANPKELFPIERKAVIDHVIETLHNHAGINKIFVIVGAHKGAIIDHLGGGEELNKGNLKIAYLFQEKREGLAHAIYQAKDWINEDFIAHVGDSFIQPKSEIKKAVKVHNEEKPFATIVAREVKDPTKYGILKIDKDNNIIDTIEKPTIEEAQPFKINGKYVVNLGVYIFNPKFFKYAEETPKGIKGEYQVPDVIKTALKRKEKIKAVIIKGEYLDIGNWESAEEAWAHFRKAKNNN
ncbi:hypothetical protein COZ55_01560 [archaeon CG_4_8_14_3_um_filter_38_5]|nr:MAG: hypothetical protein COS83_00020 [archaeon CG07_land_8_20_14_0_80_38_8]PIU89527.1 MAG: hypothetical protein COS64_00375 [archaeon CG06_land_8_20_14_3_00_37_11]PIX43037.1 MAG: hypothetical protein COZ55_01560 [archaeon CG_4_8_14_3_um_filter_38_5]